MYIKFSDVPYTYWKEEILEHGCWLANDFNFELVTSKIKIYHRQTFTMSY